MLEKVTGGIGRAATAAWRWVMPSGLGARSVAVRSAIIGVVVVAMVALPLWWANRPADIVVGAPPAPINTPTSGPRVILPPSTSSTAPDPGIIGAGRPTAGGIVPSDPDGAPYPPAIPFHSDVAVPDHLVWVLAIGSDARPGQSVTRTRADSIHLLGLNPRSGTGTILGFPRDSWVEIPGRGRGKMNSALALGGPDLLAATVRNLTGLPVDYWVVTGFSGFEAMVDTLGGVTVHVDRTMADRNSQAYFGAGWHHLDGFEALAFSRNRSDVPNGDFGRSANHGKVLLGALHKLRAEVGDQPGLGHWIGVLVNHAVLQVSRHDLEVLAATVRRTDPAAVANVVAPGRVGYAGRQSVVYLTQEAVAIFEDLRPDATIGSAPSSPPPTEPPPETTTTTTSTTEPPPVTTSTTEDLLPVG